MRRRTAALLLTLDVLAMLALAGVLAVSWQAGQGLLHPARDTDFRTPSDAGVGWEWLNLTTSDGVALAGWWVPADATPEDNGTTVFVHGYGDAKSQGVDLLPLLHRLGNAYLFDLRAHGQSGGAYTTAGFLETRDVAAAVGAVRARLNSSAAPVVLLGWSMGGATSLNAAGSGAVQVDGVVTDGAFSRLTRIVETSISRFTGLPKWPFGPLATTMAGWSVGVNLDDNAPVRAVAGWKGPLLLIQGTADATVTPDQVDDLAEAAPWAEVWKVEGGRHVESYKTDPAGYEARLAAFLKAVWRPLGESQGLFSENHQ